MSEDYDGDMVSQSMDEIDRLEGVLEPEEQEPDEVAASLYEALTPPGEKVEIEGNYDNCVPDMPKTNLRPDMLVSVQCSNCGAHEEFPLHALAVTPESRFINLNNLQCAICLGAASVEI